jgi:hypothetical protein
MVARSLQPWRGSPASGTGNKVRAITSPVTSAIAFPVTVAVAVAVARAGVVAATVIAVASVVATAIIAVAVAVVAVAVTAIAVVAVAIIAVVAVAIIAGTAVAGAAAAAASAAAASIPVAAAASVATAASVAAAPSVAAAITASGVAIAATAAGAPATTAHSRRLRIAQSRNNIHRKLSGPVPDSLRCADPENSGDGSDDHKINSGRAILILPESLEKCACACRSSGLGVLRQKNFVPEYIKHCIIPSKHARDTQTARHTAFQFAR